MKEETIYIIEKGVNYFQDPNITFDFVSDTYIWDVFSKPWCSMNPSAEKKPAITLSDYFDVTPYFDYNVVERPQRKKLLPNVTFIQSLTHRKKLIFSTLCDFLNTYCVKYTHCCVRIPYHPKNESNSFFTEYDFTYGGILKAPRLNNERNLLILPLTNEIYQDMYKRRIAPKLHIASNFTEIYFSFQSFKSFVF